MRSYADVPVTLHLSLTIAQIEFTLALCYIFICSETLYRGPITNLQSKAGSLIRRLSPYRGRIDSKSLTLFDFVQPLTVLKDFSLSLVMVAYLIAHNFVLTFGLVEFSALYIPRFHLNSDQVGLNYLSVATGCVFGMLECDFY